MSTAQPTIKDVSEAEFEQQVIAESRKRPVVVDFWAAWCGPCRTLGPILERAVNAAGGAVLLAKVDVDSNQRLAARFGVQGIPAVKAFRDGKVVSEFTGALPDAQVRRWLQALLPAGGAQLTQEAQKLEAQGQSERALALYREAYVQDASDLVALRGLVRLLLPRDHEAAQQILAQVAAGTPSYPLAHQLLDIVPLYRVAAEQPVDAELGAAPSLDDRYDWAAAQVRAGRWQVALDQLLAIVMRDRSYRDDGARRAILALFALLGDDTPLVPAYRKKLANALF